MIIHFRNAGPPAEAWNEPVDWPDGLRIPCVGEMVDLPVHHQVWVESVQWFFDEESRSLNGGEPDVQLIVAGYVP